MATTHEPTTAPQDPWANPRLVEATQPRLMSAGRIVAIMVAVLAAAGAAVAGIALVSTGSGPATQPTMTVMGNVTVHSIRIEHWDGTPGEECHGTAELQDMTAGAPVVITNDEGKTVAKTTLEQGKWYDGCVFAFTAQSVPASPFIDVEIAGRGAVTFSQDQVKSNQVRLELNP